MFISPFDLSVTMWFTAVPEFETVVDPPVAPECGTTADAGADGSVPSDPNAAPGLETVVDDAIGSGTVNLPRARQVFKGMQWVLVPVFSSRINPIYDQLTQLQRDQDEDRNEERARASQRHPSAPQDASVDTDGEVSATSDIDAAAPTQTDNDSGDAC